MYKSKEIIWTLLFWERWDLRVSVPVDNYAGACSIPRFIISSAPIGISKSFDKYYLDTWALLTDYIRVIYGKFLMQTQSNALWIELVASTEFLWLCGAERTDWPVVGILKENSASLRDVKWAQTFNIYLSGLDQPLTVRNGGLWVTVVPLEMSLTKECGQVLISVLEDSR